MSAGGFEELKQAVSKVDPRFVVEPATYDPRVCIVTFTGSAYCVPSCWEYNITTGDIGEFLIFIRRQTVKNAAIKAHTEISEWLHELELAGARQTVRFCTGYLIRKGGEMVEFSLERALRNPTYRRGVLEWAKSAAPRACKL